MNKFYQTLVIIGLLTSAMTAQTITLLKDLNPGSVGSYKSGSKNVIEFNGSILFAATTATTGVELYKYDGSDVTLVKDINPGSANSDCENFYLLNGKILFTANNGTNGKEWWSTDGTEAGTKLVKDLVVGGGSGVYSSDSPTDQYFMVDNGLIYFSGGPSNNVELYKTDGTEAGTVLVKNIAPDDFSATASYPNYYVKFKNEIYFSCRQGLYKTNGTSAGTVLVSPSPSFFDEFKDIINFKDEVIIIRGGNNLWKSDGTSVGTALLKEFSSISSNWGGLKFSRVGDYVLFPAADAASGAELWRTDGTVAGTQLVIDLLPGTEGYTPQNTVVFNNKLYYKGEAANTGLELFVSDGTAAGTKLVKEFTPGAQGGFSLPTQIITDGKSLYMNAGRSLDIQLWESDGTTNGTKEIVINNIDQAFPLNLYKFQNKLFLFAKKSNTGYEPYIIEFASDPVDGDGDGFASDVDCNDADATIFPGAQEICDAKDNNCNNMIDEGLPKFTYYQDSDNDTFGALSTPLSTCISPAPTGFVSNSTDCNDTNPNINPSATDIANNGIDEDCNGTDFVSSVYDIYASKIKVFPNPTSTFIYISSTEDIHNVVSIFTSTGVKVKDISIESSIDLSELNEGIYFLQFKVNGLNLPVYKKLVIQK